MSLLSSKKSIRAIKMLFVYLLLGAGMILVTSPFFWMLSTSLKEENDVFQIPIRWIADPPLWSNYPEALTALPFGRFILNTCFITLCAVVGSTTASALTAYAFARLQWRGRDQMFLIVLSTLMLPGQVTIIPKFVVFKYLEWIDTYLPLLVPIFFGGAAFNIFLLRQFFMTIPLELDDAARIDGCSRLGIFFRIIVPQSTPALMTIMIFIVSYRWTSFFNPLIYLYDLKKYTIALGLRMFQGQYSTRWELMMAAATVTMLPMLVLYYFGQRYFTQGIVFTGVKG